MKTNLCHVLGIEHPIIAAPMGPDLTGPELVAAVSNAGGLGILQAQFCSPPVFRQEIRRVRALTARPFGVNLLLHFPVEDQVAICLEERVPILSLFWGDPTPYVGRAHAAGVKVFHQVGSVADARRAAAAGVDVIIAQGVEAGGHVAGEVSTLALVPRVVDAVAPRPVAAAGGIADARGVVAVLALGAQAAVLGTRFLASASRVPTRTTRRSCWRPARPTRFAPPCSATAGPTPRTGPCGRRSCSSGSARRPGARNCAWTSRRSARPSSAGSPFRCCGSWGSRRMVTPVGTSSRWICWRARALAWSARSSRPVRSFASWWRRHGKSSRSAWPVWSQEEQAAANQRPS